MTVQEQVRFSKDQVFTVTPKSIGKVVVTDPLKDYADLFKRKRWGTRVTGQGGNIYDRHDTEKWYFEPTTLDNPELHPEAVVRAHAILDDGIRVQGWIIGHEKEDEQPRDLRSRWDSLSDGQRAAIIAAGGLAVLPFMLPLIAILALPLLVAAMSLGGLDPVLCAVLSDEKQTICEVLRWIP